MGYDYDTLNTKIIFFLNCVVNSSSIQIGIDFPCPFFGSKKTKKNITIIINKIVELILYNITRFAYYLF
jgi:hypothetical protein